MMTTIDEIELRFFAKHCLFLHCTETHVETRQSATRLTSGFVISVEDEWFFLTAGHCLKEIEERRATEFLYTDWALIDAFALTQERPHHIDASPPPDSIPFDIDQSYRSYLFDPKTGLDYAFLHLERPRYRRLLESNGIEPLSGINCQIPVEMARDCDSYFVIGIPADQLKILGNGRFHANIVSVELERLDSGAREWVDYPNIFHASFPQDFSRYGPDGFNSFKGLSGGPIFGRKMLPDGERYCAIGIQSYWDLRSKVRASYLVALSSWLEQHVIRVKAFIRERQDEDQSDEAA